MENDTAKNNHELILDTSILAGKIMLQSGAEISRVEDTMERIIRNALNKPDSTEAYTYVTVNGIFAKITGSETSFARIDQRDFDLNKVTKVNQLSRSFAEGDIELTEMQHALQVLEGESASIPRWLKLLCTAGLSGSIMLIFGGDYIDLPATMAAGVIAYMTYLFIWNTLNVPFLSEYTGTLIGGTIGYLLTVSFGENIDLVMVGAVVPLVPGILITNSIRDIMARHYLSGLIRFIEGIFTAGALGAGIATVYYLFII